MGNSRLEKKRGESLMTFRLKPVLDVSTVMMRKMMQQTISRSFSKTLSPRPEIRAVSVIEREKRFRTMAMKTLLGLFHRHRQIRIFPFQ
jgi:hypothetical protein